MAATVGPGTHDGDVRHLTVPGRRATLIDVAVVLGMLVFALGHDTFAPDVHRTVSTVIFDVVLTLPLAFRRYRPLEAFLLISALALAQWAWNVQAGGDFAVLVALYAVGAHERRVWRLAVATAICELGALIAVLRWTPPSHQPAAMTFLTGTVTAACVLGVYFRTRRAYIASVLERAATAERELDQQARLATATERARISREMHDIVAHSLSVMIALSDGAAASIERSPAAAENAMVQSSTVGRQALGEVRRLLGALQDSDDVELAPAPGIAQLEELATRVRAAGLRVDLVVKGEPPLPLPPAAQLTVYRMVQEAMTNVLKHAQAATMVTVTLRYTRTGLDIEVENDDQPRAGHPVASQGPVGPAQVAGHGLAGMRERAAVFAGTVEARRRSDGGWRVASRLRLDEQLSGGAG
jgi:signal transduction histidine kinase